MIPLLVPEFFQSVDFSMQAHIFTPLVSFLFMECKQSGKLSLEVLEVMQIKTGQ